MLFGTQRIKENELYIGGVAVSDLILKHGSPLYVYDQQHIEDMITLFQSNFKSKKFNTRIAYASKAFLTLEMVRLLKKKNMSMDCVSLGEMYTAYKGGFDLKKSFIIRVDCFLL